MGVDVEGAGEDVLPSSIESLSVRDLQFGPDPGDLPVVNQNVDFGRLFRGDDCAAGDERAHEALLGRPTVG